MEEKRPFRPKRSRRKVCKFCVEKAASIDYKDIRKLQSSVAESGKIMPRRTVYPPQKESDKCVYPSFCHLELSPPFVKGGRGVLLHGW